MIEESISGALEDDPSWDLDTELMIRIAPTEENPW